MTRQHPRAFIRENRDGVRTIEQLTAHPDSPYVYRRASWGERLALVTLVLAGLAVPAWILWRVFR